MRIRWHSFIVGLFCAAAWAGPFSDVPRNDPLYDSFRFLQEQGVLEGTLVKLPAEGALTRYEFAVATVDALDYIKKLLAQAEAVGGEREAQNEPPEVRRCHAEMRQLLREFRPELQKLGVDVATETRNVDRFLKIVPSLHLTEQPPLAAPPAPPPTEPVRFSEGSATAPANVRIDPLLARDQAALALLAPRDATEVQEILARTHLAPFSRSGEGDLNTRSPGFSRYTLQPQSGRNNPASRELSLRTSLGGARFQLIHAEREEDHYQTDPYDLYGARATFDLWGGTGGLTYLRSEPGTAPGSPPERQIYGADMRLPLGEYGLYLEYARSQVPNLGPGSAGAFEAGVQGPLAADLTVGAAYRSVDPSFRTPGFWGAWGRQANPTNIRGFRFTGDYRPQESLRLLSSYEYYLPRTTTPDPGLSRALANLEYGPSDKVSLSIGYEFIRRSGFAYLGPEDELERSITAGLAYDLSDDVFFRLSHRRSLQDRGLRSPADDDNITVSEFSVRF